MNLNVTKTSPQTFTQDQAFGASLKYFKNDDLAARVWLNKYALKDSHGNLYEFTPNDMHRRIAKELVRVEKKYAPPLTEEEIFDLIKDFKYIVPQRRPISGFGNPYQRAPQTNCL